MSGEPPEDPAVALAPAGLARDLQPAAAPAARWEGDAMTLAVCAFLALALLRAYLLRPSPAFSYWSGSIMALMLCEYFAAFAGAGALAYRKSVLAGRPETMILVAGSGVLLMAIGVAVRFLDELLPILAFMGLLAARVRMGLKASAERGPEMGTRFAVAIVANLMTLFPAMFSFRTPAGLTMAGFLYFTLLALFELNLILRRFTAPG